MVRPARPRTINEAWQEFSAGMPADVTNLAMTESNVLGIFLAGAAGMLELMVSVVLSDPEHAADRVDGFTTEIKEFVRQHEAKRHP